MASISGFGNVGGPEGYKRPSGVSKKEADSNPQVGTDGFVSSHVPTRADKQEVAAQQPVAEKAPAQKQAAVPTRNAVPVTLSMDGVVGINDLGKSESVGLSAFTNGLGSNTIVGLSGKVLAGANPFSSHQ